MLEEGIFFMKRLSSPEKTPNALRKILDKAIFYAIIKYSWRKHGSKLQT
jgi:hypothetical protein